MDSSAPKPASSSFAVAGYITAYEDAEALNACIAAIKGQTYPVRQILIVDNSPQRLSLLPSLSMDDTILIWPQPENLGIAGGLELALQWASEQKYDFLWTFDQDSAPFPECLALLLKAYTHLSHDHEIGIMAPTAIDARTGEIVKPSLFLGDRFRGFQPADLSVPYECDAPITSGSLVRLEAARQIRPPDRDLFMDGIDLDYGLRLRKAAFHHFVVPDAKMHHRFGMPCQVQLLGRKKTIQLYSPLRYYYICRNQTYIELYYSQGWNCITCSLRRIKFLLLTILKILLFDSGFKSRKIYACVQGTYHGFIGKLGKIW